MNTLRLNSGRCKHFKRLSQKENIVSGGLVRRWRGKGKVYFNDRLTLAVMFPKLNTEVTSIHVLQFL